MKKTNRTILAMTAAVVALTGCVKENLAPQGTEDGMVTVTLIADDATTKTQMNADGNNVIWTPKNELKYFYADQIRIKDSEITQNDLTHNKISFSLNVSQGTQEINGFVGGRINTRVMRKEIVDNGITKTTKVTAFGIELPAVQTTKTKTFDENADVLIMPNVKLEAQNTQQELTIEGLKYKRLNAITKLVMTLNKPEAATEERIQSIKFATKNTDLAGSFTYDYKKNLYIDMNGNEKDGVFFTENPSKEISMYYPGKPKLQDIEYTFNNEKRTGYGITGFMVSAPVTLAGETVTITMTTDANEYVKTVNIASESTFKLNNNQLNQIVVDMSTAAITAQDTDVYRFDLTKAPTLANANSGLNNFMGDERFRYDDSTNPNLVFVADSDMQFDQNTTSSHVMKAGQSFSIQGEAIQSVDIIMANEHSSNHNAIFSTDHGKCTDNASGATWKSDIAKGRHKVVFMLNKTVTKANIKEIIVRYVDTTNDETAGTTEDVRFDTEFSTPIIDFASDATPENVQTVDLYNTRWDLEALKITTTDPSTNPYDGDKAPLKFDVRLEKNKLSVAVKEPNGGTEAVKEEVWIYNKYTSFKLNLKQLASGQVSEVKETIDCKAGNSSKIFEITGGKWTQFGLRLAYNGKASSFTIKVKDTTSTIKIKGIEVETKGTDITSDPDTGWDANNMKWTGAATSITFKNSKEKVDITKLTILYEK